MFTRKNQRTCGKMEQNSEEKSRLKILICKSQAYMFTPQLSPEMSNRAFLWLARMLTEWHTGISNSNGLNQNSPPSHIKYLFLI